jgi:uncharacterized protein (TIGR02118 family)
MIRVTVLYNLPPETDEAEFLRWRLGEHQATNAGMPGVVRTDFGRITGVHPPEGKAPYRFMTTVDFPDEETFRKSFYSEENLAGLEANLSIMADPIFLISEILVETKNEP